MSKEHSILMESGDFNRARQEYENTFQYLAVDLANLRALIQMDIDDSYVKERKYIDAETGDT